MIIQIKIYLYSSADVFANLRSVKAIYEIINIAKEENLIKTVYLARLSLLFFCKILQNQILVINFNAVSILETLDKFPVPNELFQTHIYWLSIFAKDCGEFSLKNATNSLIITAIKNLQHSRNITNKYLCLKTIAYLYMTELCSNEHYGRSEISLIIEELDKALKSKNEKYIGNALKAAGSILMRCHNYWGKRWPDLVTDLSNKLIIAQDIKIDEFKSEIMRQINNDAKLSLTLIKERNNSCKNRCNERNK